MKIQNNIKVFFILLIIYGGRSDAMEQQPRYLDLQVHSFSDQLHYLPATDSTFKTKPLIDVMAEKRPSKPLSINIDVKDGNAYVHRYEKGFELYFPKDVPQVLDPTEMDKKGWLPRVGGFGVVEHEGKLLFIQRKDDSWYVPGGNAEISDGSLAKTAVREVQEETNINLDTVKGVPLHAYESVIHNKGVVRYRTLMFFFYFYYFGKDNLVPQTNECKAAEWIAPYEFLNTYEKNEKYSKPSIKEVLSQWSDLKLKEYFEDPLSDELWLPTIKQLREQLVSLGGENLALKFNLAVIEAYGCRCGNVHLRSFLEDIYKKVKKDAKL